MTIKMLIVDDEPIIREGLRHTIPWDSYGVQVIDEASNGREASEILSKNQVDIVLTDVRMPEMDGIQLAKFIHEHMSHIQVVIISGYDDFDYAREALRYRVKNYLLKPVDIDELVATVNEITEHIIQERVQTETEEMKSLRETVSNFILNPHLPRPNVNHDLFQGAKYRVVVSELHDYATIAIKHSPEELDEMRTEWEREVSQFFKGSISFFAHTNLYVSVVFDDEFNQEKLLESDNKLIFGVSNVFTDPLNVVDAYKQAKEAIYTKELSDERVLYYNGKIKSIPTIDYPLLYEALFNDDIEALKELVNDLFENMKQEHYSLTDMREFCHALNVNIEKKLQSLVPKDSLADASCQATAEFDLHFYNTSDWLQTFVLADLKMWLYFLEKVNQGKKSWSVEKAIEYIKENFHRELKASEVANEIHITPNYFSMIFKKELGKSFNDYLNDLRIEKAMQLLTETSDRVYEIATEVGYKEYKYFVQVFRKKTGMTPTDYRTYKG